MRKAAALRSWTSYLLHLKRNRLQMRKVLLFLWKKCSEKNPFLSKIFVWVLGIHLFLLLALALVLRPVRSEKKMIVRNFSPAHVETPSIKIPSPPAPSSPPKSAPAPKPTPKPAPPPPAKKKPAPTPKPKPQKPLPSLPKLEPSPPSSNISSKPLSVPAPIALSSGSEKEAPVLEKISYSDLLVLYLEETLELPEKGEVKIRLFLHEEGKLLSLEILQAESKKNLDYLKNTLPALAFPCFNGQYPEKERSFTVRFRSKK